MIHVCCAVSTVNATTLKFMSTLYYRIAGNFRELQAIRENIICECLVFVDKDRAIALTRKKIIREMLYLAHSRKFSPEKISCYTVLTVMLHEECNTYHHQALIL